MSAAAHLLRRRSSFILRRPRIPPISTPGLGAAETSQKRPPFPSGGHRKFSATATSKSPGNSASGSSSSSGSTALKYTTAGAAVLLLSSAAWYTTRDEYPQHLSLPQLFSSRYEEQRATGSQIDEKPLSYVQSNQVQEERVVEEGVVDESGEAISDEHGNREEQALFERGDEGVVHEESRDGLSANGPPEPPQDFEQTPPLTSELDAGPHESEGEEILASKLSSQEHGEASNETEHEHTPPASAADPDKQSALDNLIGTVKDKISVVKEYVLDEANDVSNEGDEATDLRDEVRDDVPEIREKLIERHPDMFESDSDSSENESFQHEGGHVEHGPELVEMLESGSCEHIGAHRVPSKLSPSYLVQRGHEDSVRRYSEKDSEREFSDLVETGEIKREENHSEEISGEETKVAEEKPNVVAVDVLVGAIDTAKQLQAEVDERAFKEHVDKLEEAHQRQVNEYEAKIFAYAKSADHLEKELKKEKEEAATALMLQQLKAEEKLQSEMKRKEEAANEEIQRLQLLEKALAAASLTREKAEHLEDIYSIQLQVDALRTAFYTHSEEARVSHTAHKLAMGTFALEDALERGAGVEKEADLLIVSAGGAGVDPLVDAIVSSLPSEVMTIGSETRAQLHQKFSRLKGSLRELALMSSGGGGVLAHFFAKVAATIKIGEQGSDTVGSEGIEAVIGKVERLLADEKLIEAAVVLETGARGTAAERLAIDWARQARNRAIIEQGLQALRAHVIAVASGLS